MKSQNKPLYKQLIRLRENIQNWKKIFKFQKQKWKEFINAYQWSFNWFRKFWAWDRSAYISSQRCYRFLSYWNRYQNLEFELKKLRLFYGHLSKHNSKVLTRKSKKVWSILNLMESRLNAVLNRSKFTQSIKSADQMILQKKIRVNCNIVTLKSFVLKGGDLIQISLKGIHYVWKNIKCMSVWPTPPKHLIINYKTLQILFGLFNNSSTFFSFLHRINTEKLTTSKYH